MRPETLEQAWMDLEAAMPPGSKLLVGLEDGGYFAAVSWYEDEHRSLQIKSSGSPKADLIAALVECTRRLTASPVAA